LDGYQSQGSIVLRTGTRRYKHHLHFALKVGSATDHDAWLVTTNLINNSRLLLMPMTSMEDRELPGMPKATSDAGKPPTLHCITPRCAFVASSVISVNKGAGWSRNVVCVF